MHYHRYSKVYKDTGGMKYMKKHKTVSLKRARNTLYSFSTFTYEDICFHVCFALAAQD